MLFFRAALSTYSHNRSCNMADIASNQTHLAQSAISLGDKQQNILIPSRVTQQIMLPWCALVRGKTRVKRGFSVKTGAFHSLFTEIALAFGLWRNHPFPWVNSLKITARPTTGMRSGSYNSAVRGFPITHALILVNFNTYAACCLGSNQSPLSCSTDSFTEPRLTRSEVG